MIDRLDTISGKDDLLFIGTKDLRAYYFSFSHSSVTKSRVLEFYASLKAEMSEFAFQYKQCYSINGWKIYNQEREFARLGLFNNILYRKTDLNRDYDLSPSYPSDVMSFHFIEVRYSS